MINLFIETNIGADDKQVSFYIEAFSCDVNGWEIFVEDPEGCSKHEACQWVRDNHQKLVKKIETKAREMREESELHMADIA